MAQLREVGLDPTVIESEPGRTSVVVRIEGEDRDRPALAIHGHLDVVPANADDWQVDPFAGVEKDGCIWGRGAVDMKDMDAMILACIRDLARTGTKPPRDIVFAFFADEEAGGVKGSHYVVDHHAELFEGVTEAVSEVGGYSRHRADQGRRADPRLPRPDRGEGHPLAAPGRHRPGRARLGAERRERPRAAGRGDQQDQRPQVATGVHRLGRELLDGLSDLTGTSYSDEDLEELLEHLGGAQGFVRGTLQDTANFTMARPATSTT